MEAPQSNTREYREMREKYHKVFEIIKYIPINEAREVIAMLYDLRPVAEMQLEVDENQEKELSARMETLTHSGLSVEISEFPHDSERTDVKSLVFYISKDPQLAREVKKLCEESVFPPLEDFHRRYGQLMGFPQTAIDAYVARSCLSQEEKDTLGFPKDYEGGPCVIPFGISRSHYAEEAKYLKKYFNALKESFPDTYGTTLSGESLEKYKHEVEAFLVKDFSE